MVKRPFLSGHCGPSNPAHIHAQCRGEYDGHVCTCVGCHAKPEPVDLTPGSPAWSRIITASKVAAILGVSPWQSPRSLWHEMRGDVERPPSNAAQSRGHYLEPAILAWWRDQHGVADDRQWTAQPTYRLGDWAAATPDAVTLGIPGLAECLVEAKSAADMDEWGEPGTDQIPAYYLAQVHWQLHVSKAVRCYVPVIGPYLRFSEYVVDRDDEIGALLEARCREFYDSLAGDEPPPLDNSTATLEVLRRLHPDITKGETVQLNPDDAREWLTASAAAKAAETRLTGAKSRVLDALAGAQYGEANGVRVARRQASGKGIALYATATADQIPDTQEPAA